MSAIFADPLFARRWAIRLALVWFGLLYVRVAWVSHAEVELAASAQAEGRIRVAIAHYRRAARHVAPPLDASTEALAALVSIADAAERSRDVDTALLAHRSVRGAILATRPLGLFRGRYLEEADERIATLVARDDHASTLRDSSLDAVRRMHRRTLTEQPSERAFGTVLALLGFATFVAASQRLLTRGVDLDDRLVRPVLGRAAMLAGFGFLVFVVGLLIT